METTLPKSFQAIWADQNGKNGYLEETSLPTPGKNQVLIKVAFGPINPSDLATMRGGYQSISGKIRVGMEGSGYVVGLGEDLVVKHNIGDKVHFLGLGSWGQYVVTDSTQVFPIIANITMEEAACHFVNPGTVVMMERLVRKGEHKAAIHTAGSSALGRMMIRYFKDKGIKLISIVRKKEYVEELTKDGADSVIVSSEEGWEKRLKEVAAEYNATIAFDAIGGETTGKLLKALPHKSNIFVYGALGGIELKGINVTDFLFTGSSVTGLWLTPYITSLKPEEAYLFFKEVHQNLGGSLKSKIQKVFTLNKLEDALELYAKSASEGKILFSAF